MTIPRGDRAQLRARVQDIAEFKTGYLASKATDDIVTECEAIAQEYCDATRLPTIATLRRFAERIDSAVQKIRDATADLDMTLAEMPKEVFRTLAMADGRMENLRRRIRRHISILRKTTNGQPLLSAVDRQYSVKRRGRGHRVLSGSAPKQNLAVAVLATLQSHRPDLVPRMGDLYAFAELTAATFEYAVGWEEAGDNSLDYPRRMALRALRQIKRNSLARIRQ